jgi:hypothetical protein
MPPGMLAISTPRSEPMVAERPEGTLILTPKELVKPTFAGSSLT